MPDNKIEIERYDCANSESVDENVENIEKLHMQRLSYDDFFCRFMKKNVPIVITGIADQWDCTNWSKDGSADFDYLREKIDAKLQVPVANCNKTYYNAHEKVDFTFDDFLVYWRGRIDGSNEQQDVLYLKDWHLRREQPEYKFYETPLYFASDWLNEYCTETNGDDYRFVYMGPKGTWTPFHVDVYSSYSWSTNIMGTKKWVFFAPGQEEKLYDKFKNLPFDVTEDKYLKIIEENNIKMFEIIQKAGDTIFVPSGWHHQVWNMDDTISVNHNWFNGCNIMRIWQSMNEKFKEVCHEIDDCKDMDNFEEHCQVMLKQVFGMDFQMFMDVLNLIVKNRLQILNADTIFIVNEAELGTNHAIFDLKAVEEVTKDIFDKCGIEEIKQSCQQILKNISETVT